MTEMENGEGASTDECRGKQMCSGTGLLFT